jgi:hypothetical protein
MYRLQPVIQSLSPVLPIASNSIKESAVPIMT